MHERLRKLGRREHGQTPLELGQRVGEPGAIGCGEPGGVPEVTELGPERRQRPIVCAERAQLVVPPHPGALDVRDQPQPGRPALDGRVAQRLPA